MPIWHVYHPVGAYTDHEKREFADRVTDFYQPLGLPRFYVVTLFHEVSQGSFYVGGEPVDDVVRVVIEHTAQDPARRAAGRHRIADMIQPFVAGK
jgi:phenylpyruvate tautomerase PptA (4-oxalocrotonate tautomerase family)